MFYLHLLFYWSFLFKLYPWETYQTDVICQSRHCGYVVEKMLAPWCRLLCGRNTPAREPCTTHTYLAGETPWSWRWFTHGEAQPLHFGCADPCEFLKCGNLDCIICGSGGLRSRSPLILMWKINCGEVYLFFTFIMDYNSWELASVLIG